MTSKPDTEREDRKLSIWITLRAEKWNFSVVDMELNTSDDPTESEYKKINLSLRFRLLILETEPDLDPDSL